MQKHFYDLREVDDLADGEQALPEPGVTYDLRTMEIENTAAPGTNWMMEQRGSHELSFVAHALNEPREHFVMPLLLGSLCDHSGRPWFQSSVYEFLPAVEGIKTTNIGGKPMFKANLRPGQIRSQPAVQMNAALN
jgi:hypothetical protein